jgi:hypothetical protein
MKDSRKRAIWPLPTNLLASAGLGASYYWLHEFALGKNPKWTNELEEESGRSASFAHLVYRDSDLAAEAAQTFRPEPSFLELGSKQHPFTPEDVAKVYENATKLQATIRSFVGDVVALAIAAPEFSEGIASIAIMGWVYGMQMGTLHAPYWRPYTDIGLKSFAGAKKGGDEVRAETKHRQQRIRHSVLRLHAEKQSRSFNWVANKVAEAFSISGRQVRRICSDLKW